MAVGATSQTEAPVVRVHGRKTNRTLRHGPVTHGKPIRRIRIPINPPPILCLSCTPNILLRIFGFCIFSRDTEIERRNALIPLVGVCRLWRDATYLNPHFWAVIHIVIPYGHLPSRSSSLSTLSITTWLQRTQSVPLRITLLNHAMRGGERDVLDALSLLEPHRSRWLSLTCEIHKQYTMRLLSQESFPLLKTLNLLEDYLYGFPWERFSEPVPLKLSLYPKLLFVRCAQHPGVKFLFNKDDPPYALKYIRPKLRVSLSDCSQIIRNSPLMTDFDAECKVKFPFDSPQAPGAQHRLTRLLLTICAHDKECNSFLDSLILPSLESLEIRAKPTSLDINWSESLPRFLQRSSPPLRYLHIHGCDSGLILKSLQYIPDLYQLYSPVDADAASRVLACNTRPVPQYCSDSGSDADAEGETDEEEESEEKSDPDEDAAVAEAGADPVKEAAVAVAVAITDSKSNVVPYLGHLELRCYTWTCRTSLFELIRSRWGGPSGRFPEDGALNSVKFHLDPLLIEKEDLKLTVEALRQFMDEGLEVTWEWENWRWDDRKLEHVELLGEEVEEEDEFDPEYVPSDRSPSPLSFGTEPDWWENW